MWNSIRLYLVRLGNYLDVQFLNPRLLPVCLASLAFIVFVAVVVYVPVTKSGLNEFAQFLGQAVTVITFVFAVYQYRKARETARITYIAKEADSLIPKMSESIRSLDPTSKTFLEDLFKVLGRLANLGTDFADFYGHLPQGIERRIVGSHWQNMFLDDLSAKLSEIKVADIIEDRQRFEVANKIIIDMPQAMPGTRDLLWDYEVASIVLKEQSFFLKGMTHTTLLTHSSTVYLFKSYYFDRKSTAKMANNSWFGTDMRVRAPVLAALYEIRMEPIETKVRKPLW